MSLGVRRKLADVQVTVQFLTLRQRLRIAELPHVPPIFVENDHQVRFPERPHRDFAFRQSRH